MANRARPKSSKTPTSPAVACFEFIHAGAREVCLAGSFSDWAPMPMLSLESGRWVKQLTLPPGRHEYRFVVDGQWVDDPSAKETVPDLDGGMNAVLRIAPH
jgi:1,4-alpha-glucan branching enzyme